MDNIDIGSNKTEGTRINEGERFAVKLGTVRFGPDHRQINLVCSIITRETVHDYSVRNDLIGIDLRRINIINITSIFSNRQHSRVSQPQLNLSRNSFHKYSSYLPSSNGSHITVNRNQLLHCDQTIILTQKKKRFCFD